MTFGSTTLIDLLSWMVALALGAKAIATLVVLIVNKQMRDQPGWGSALWWVTKITPIIAVPCVLWIGLLAGDRSLVWVGLVLGVFIIIALPLKIRQRRHRIAKRSSTDPRAGR